MAMQTEGGVPVLYHAYGTDVAFACPCCDHPVLATPKAPPNIRRGTREHPVACRRCMTNYWVESLPNEDITLHRG